MLLTTIVVSCVLVWEYHTYIIPEWVGINFSELGDSNDWSIIAKKGNCGETSSGRKN